MAQPNLESQERGTDLDIYWQGDSPSDNTRDDTVSHNIPKREGDIQQDMGSGSRVYEGTINVTASMHASGIEGYIDELRAMASDTQPLIYTEENGDTFEATLKHPDVNRGTDLGPNLKRVSIVIQEYTQ